MLRVCPNGEQRLGGGFEQEVVHHRLVLVGDIANLARHGDDDVEVGNG